jgi:SAM-dependent methyltransferase
VVVTPDRITVELENARKQAESGNLSGALVTCKSILKADASNAAAFRLYRSLYRASRGEDLPHDQIFNFIYEANTWSAGSGLGSLPAATTSYRTFLADFIKNNDIRSVVDAGCGDWQFSQLMDWTRVDYVGIDVSSTVLKNTARFAKPGIRFVEGDVRTIDLPEADLLIMKDVLQHWSNADIISFIPRFGRFRFCLITNGASPAVMRLLNADVTAGSWRPVDLSLKPFLVAGKYVLSYTISQNTPEGQKPLEQKRVFLISRA